MFFLLFYQLYPWNPLSTYNNHKTPSIYQESLPQVSSKGNRALITARLALLNCTLEQKSAWGKHSLWHICMEKFQRAPWLGLPSASLSSLSVSLMGFLLQVFFWLLRCWERGNLWLTDTKPCMILLSSQWKNVLPFLYMVMRELLLSPSFR